MYDLELKCCPLLVIEHHQVVMTTRQCPQIHRDHTAINKVTKVISAVLTAQLINHLHTELLVHITQKPDIEQAAARIRIDTDRRCKHLVTLKTIIDRNVHNR